MVKRTHYAAARRAKEKPQRLVVTLPKDDVARIDEWGIAAGKSCRSEAVRALLNKSLETQDKQMGPD